MNFIWFIKFAVAVVWKIGLEGTLRGRQFLVPLQRTQGELVLEVAMIQPSPSPDPIHLLLSLLPLRSPELWTCSAAAGTAVTVTVRAAACCPGRSGGPASAVPRWCR